MYWIAPSTSVWSTGGDVGNVVALISASTVVYKDAVSVRLSIPFFSLYRCLAKSICYSLRTVYHTAGTSHSYSYRAFPVPNIIITDPYDIVDPCCQVRLQPFFGPLYEYTKPLISDHREDTDPEGYRNNACFHHSCSTPCCWARSSSYGTSAT